MKTPRDPRIFILMITLLSLLFVAASIIPIILPSLFAYAYGFNSPRDKQRYGITKYHVLGAAFIGELFFAVFIAFALNSSMKLFSHPKMFGLLIIVFILNYLCSVIFYWRGTKQRLVNFN
ncbi:MAG: hypothetical protein HY931_03190 [Candidatus Falkowbacteria bacterium]|nr:MAG: hypothetical protein HY931_03190 [Candidatus Falkowbacteria bacterium]